MGMVSRWIAHLDAVAHHEVLDAHRVPLADAVDAVDRLLLDGGVPPRVEQVDGLRGDQVEPHAALVRVRVTVRLRVRLRVRVRVRVRVGVGVGARVRVKNWVRP